MIYVTGPRRRHIQETKKRYFTNNWGSSYASIELIEGRNKKEMKRSRGENGKKGKENSRDLLYIK